MDPSQVLSQMQARLWELMSLGSVLIAIALLVIIAGSLVGLYLSEGRRPRHIKIMR